MLADAVARADAVAERACQERVDVVLAVLGGTVQEIKLVLSLQGRGTGTLRMPAPELSPEARQRIARLVEAAPAR
jgi:dihydrodipicolinate synthase/N-acetylneuraminate lyase